MGSEYTDPDGHRRTDCCPVCEAPVASVVLVGPDEAVVSPCGHRVPPDWFF